MLNKILALMVMVFFVAGCGTEVRTYVMTKDRVGLDQGNGNGGCIMGKCEPQPAPTKTTRKVYVLELTRPVPESEVKKIEETAVNAIVDEPTGSTSLPAEAAAPAPVDTAQAAPAAVPVIPVIGDQPDTAATPSADQNGGNVQAQTYTVQKDDTLQKISKKVYGTYAHWYKIYKANKDKIKNPNVVKPGTVLTLPVIK